MQVNNRFRTVLLLILYAVLLFGIGAFVYKLCNGDCSNLQTKELILGEEQYKDDAITSVPSKLMHRIQVQPFNLVSLIIFALAITHTFFAHYFTALSKKNAGKEYSFEYRPR